MTFPLPHPLSRRQAGGFALLAVATFHIAQAFPAAAWLIGVFLYALVRLTCVPTHRQAFYLGLALGVAVYAPHLLFFLRLFGPGAILLWLILAFWLGLFLLLGHLCRRHFQPRTALLLLPVIWLGVEYFRGELYFLRFTWLAPAFHFAFTPLPATLGAFGAYGLSFLLVAGAGAVTLLPRRYSLPIGTCLLALLAALTLIPFASPPATGDRQLRLVGIQLEFPEEKALLNSLDRLVADHPDAPFIVLSELTFNGPIPGSLRDWCRDNERHVLVGAKEPVDETKFYNTAVVIGPDGSTVFQQHKIVPVQLMNDGIPGKQQALWDSPWGRLGIAICYDLSYTRVMDELVRQGAEALLIPTMDVIDWGRREHELHARVATVRAAEYRLPIFRLCSSGISQSVDPSGTIRATAPFPGQGEVLADTLELRGPGRLPWDRPLAPAAVVATAGLALWFALSGLLRRHVKP